MRTVLAAFVLALAACGEPATLRQVSIESPQALRLSLRELPAATLRAMGLRYGLAVVKAGELAERAGLRVGDVVYAVNEHRLRDIEDFAKLVAAQPESLRLSVRRGDSDFYVPLDLGEDMPGFPGAPRPASRDTLLRT